MNHQTTCTMSFAPGDSIEDLFELLRENDGLREMYVQSVSVTRGPRGKGPPRSLNLVLTDTQEAAQTGADVEDATDLQVLPGQVEGSTDDVQAMMEVTMEDASADEGVTL